MGVFDDIYKAIMKVFMPPDEYVVDAAKLKCDCGTITTLLYIPPEPAVVAKGMGHPSQITGKIETRENDAKVPKNIKPFGDCKKNDNKSCRKFIKISGDKWQETNEEHLLEGQPTVTLQSFLICEVGGKITPLDSGQNNMHTFDQEIEELDNVIRQYEARIVAKNFEWFLKYDQIRRSFWSEKDGKGNPKYNPKFSRDQTLFREVEIAFAKDKKNTPPDVSADIKEMMAEMDELPIVKNQKDRTLAYTMGRFTQMVNTNQPMDFKNRIYKGSGMDAEKYSYENILANAEAANVDTDDLEKMKTYIKDNIGVENVNFNEWSVLARPFKDDIGLGSKDGLVQHDDYGNFIYGQVGAHVFANGERSEAEIRGLLKYGAGIAQFGSNLSNTEDGVKNNIEEKEHFGELEVPENIKGNYTEYVTNQKIREEFSRYFSSVLMEGQYGDSADENGSDSDVINKGIDAAVSEIGDFLDPEHRQRIEQAKALQARLIQEQLEAQMGWQNQFLRGMEQKAQTEAELRMLEERAKVVKDQAGGIGDIIRNISR